MTMNLKLVKSPSGVVPTMESMSFGPAGGVIGRAESNDWVLSDPEKYLSSRHCRIACEEGQYFLIDISTNGTYVNGSDEPLGRDNRVALNDRDTIEVGEYSFVVELGGGDPFSASPFDAASPSSSAAPAGDVFGEPADDGWGHAVASSDPFDLGSSSSGESADPFASSLSADSADPFASPQVDGGCPGDSFGSSDFGSSDLSGGADDADADYFGQGSQGDEGSALQSSVDWPESQSDGSLIPEDWLGGGTDPFAAPTPSRDSAASPPKGDAYQNTPPPGHSPSSASPGEYQSTAQPSRPSPEPFRSEPSQQPPNIGGHQAPPQSPPGATGYGVAENYSRQPPAGYPPSHHQPSNHQPPPPRPNPPNHPGGQTPQGPEGYYGAAGGGHYSQNYSHPPQGAAPQGPNPYSASSGQGPSSELLQAMGLSGHNLNAQKAASMEAVVGSVMRETIGGLMQILRSRTSIKNEFRMNVTTIQPVENNPIKFSASVDEVLDIMFVHDTKAYKEPVAAVRESFQSIADHQVAILAGIRSAFKAVMERFDPEALEAKFERQGKTGGLLPGMQKAKYWTSYEEHYKEMVEDMENSFQHLFGEEFVQAYEEQLRKIAIARKLDT